MSQANESHITRRSLAAAIPALAGAAMATSAAAASRSAVARPESRLAALYLEADAITARKATLNANADDVPEADWDEFFNREKALVLEVLALPATRAHAAIKARVVGMIHDDDWQGLEEDAGAQWDKALSVQVLRAMAGAV